MTFSTLTPGRSQVIRISSGQSRQEVSSDVKLSTHLLTIIDHFHNLYQRLSCHPQTCADPIPPVTTDSKSTRSLFFSEREWLAGAGATCRPLVPSKSDYILTTGGSQPDGRRRSALIDQCGSGVRLAVGVDEMMLDESTTGHTLLIELARRLSATGIGKIGWVKRSGPRGWG